MRSTHALLLFAVGCLMCLSTAVFADRPNIVYILADDLGYGDLGCYNRASRIPTPNLDRLASQGMIFTDAHSPSAVCTPTRYGILTGRYAWRTRLKSGVLWGRSPMLMEPGRETVASLLKRHGYVTACVGKWHLGLQEGEETDYDKPLTPGPNTVGFDYFFGIPASLDMDPYVFVENDRLVEAPTATIEASTMARHGGGGFWRAGPIAPGFRHAEVLPVTVEKSIAWLEKVRKASPDSPFFLYMPLSAPHTPWLPTDAYRGKSGAGPYGDFVMQVDDSVGRVLEALDRLGVAENTLVIFTSDNGAHWLESDIRRYEHLANNHLRGQKADIHDGGHRVPFIVRWPGKVKAGSFSTEVTCLTDLMATCATIVGDELSDDAGEDSMSMLPALLGQPYASPLREAIVHHSLNGMFAIRQGPWKLILGRGSGGFTAPQRIDPAEGEPAGQLYHLEDDPAESVNLWASRPEVVARLTALLDKYQREGRSR